MILLFIFTAAGAKAMSLRLDKKIEKWKKSKATLPSQNVFKPQNETAYSK